MKTLKLAFLAALFLAGCATPEEKEFPNSFTVVVANPMDESRSAVMVSLSLGDITAKAADFNTEAFIVMDGKSEIASQLNANELEDKGIVFVLDSLGAKESRTVTVRYNPQGVALRNYPKRTQAELAHKVNGSWKDREYMGGEFVNVNYLRVPPEHKDHSWFIRYEGPGWESDKVGYRFYLDQRNAVDVFGKTVTEPVLHKVGLDGFDSYHEMQDWGMDVMKVGKTLGLGSIGMLVDGSAVRVEATDSLISQILENGVVYSSILTDYYGWKTKVDTLNLSSKLTIHAGTRLTHQLLTLSGDNDMLCTGIVKDEKATLQTADATPTSFAYAATFGPQSLHNDNLGLAVLCAPAYFSGFAEDELSHIMKLKSSGGKLDYYLLAAWELEPAGIKTEEAFIAYVKKVARELAQPVAVSIK